MKTPVDRNDQPLSAYLLKILTILVKKSGGELRIDATDMMEETDGEGLSKRYDREKKQLVITHIESGSEIYFNKSGDDQWPSNLPSPKSLSGQPGQRSRSSVVQPLRQSDLQENLISDQESRMSASTIDDNRIADLEDHLRKQAAARILTNFPETPVTHPRSQPREVQPSRRVQPSFYRG